MENKIVIATQNKNKFAEIRTIIKDFGMDILSMTDVGLGDLDIVEDGLTCQENSYIKASTVSKLTGYPAIADDVGLFIEALNGEPGIYTARYAGEFCNEAANRKKVLDNLKAKNALTKEKRKAYCLCVITMSYPDGEKIVCEGICHGHIADSEVGTKGYGYDSIFIPEGYSQTFGELSEDIRNEIYHRAKALAELKLKILL